MEDEEPIIILDSDTTCSICYAEFLDSEDLEIHFRQVHSSSKKCQLCLTSYTDSLDYALHIRDTHLTEIKSCLYCSKIFNNKRQWTSHTRKHICHYDRKLFNCSQCSQKFNNKLEVEQHEYEFHNNDKDGVILYECFQELSSILNIKASIFLQSLDTDTNYVCVQCKLDTTDVTKYIQHLQREGCRSFVCSQCCNVHKTKKSIARHLKIHDTQNNKMNHTKTCNVCEKEISYLLFNKHKSFCKPIKCYKCNEMFKTMYELGNHQMEKHPSSLELKTCKFCQRECVGDGVLEKHIERTHKGQLHLYKYLCVYCNLPFKHPQKLFGHFFSRHKDIEPYTCKICDMKFRVRKAFSLHIKLKHNSVGFVEFEENYHVFFTDVRSENPFQPYSIYEDEDSSDAGETKENTAQELDNENSDFMDPTETEGNNTEVEEKVKQKTLKRKSMPKRTGQAKKSRKNYENNFEVSSDDEPLQLLKERTRKKPRKRTRINQKKNFTCDICNKYCYTYQNYHNHMTLHSRNDQKVCIKCSMTFKSKNALEDHMTKAHSSSRLTDTLKNVIEKRKLGISTFKELTVSERFRRTIRGVQCDKTVPAKLTKLPKDGLSVQKFIESFTPEESVKKSIKINNNVSITTIKGPYVHKEIIKMSKFKPTVYASPVRLALPVKFKPNYTEKVTAHIKLIQKPIKKQTSFTFEPETTDNINETNEHTYDDDDMDRDENIPEVAEEVMLENTEENVPTQLPHKIIIPKLPEGYKEVHIAHMLPEAPFFKIVKVKEGTENKLNAKEQPRETIKLPDGTKLVTVNPLAHLLGDKPMEELFTPIKKYYKPKQKNFESVLAKALMKLDQPTPSNRRKGTKKGQSVPIEQ